MKKTAFLIIMAVLLLSSLGILGSCTEPMTATAGETAMEASRAALPMNEYAIQNWWTGKWMRNNATLLCLLDPNKFYTWTMYRMYNNGQWSYVIKVLGGALPTDQAWYVTVVLDYEFGIPETNYVPILRGYTFAQEREMIANQSFPNINRFHIKDVIPIDQFRYYARFESYGEAYNNYFLGSNTNGNAVILYPGDYMQHLTWFLIDEYAGDE